MTIEKTSIPSFPTSEIILVIGNGFDLAHGLPTDYSSFLQFLNLVHQLIGQPNDKAGFTNSVRDSNLCKNNDVVRDFLLRAADIKGERVNELLCLAQNNYWVEFFHRISKSGRNWIDFEGEMSKAIQRFDPKSTTKAYASLPSSIFEECIVDGIEYLNDKEKKINKLAEDLGRLTRCLEIYLCICQEEVIKPEKKLRCLLELPFISHVLSFNYTDTFSRAYQNEFHITSDKCCFIHGKANICNTVDTNNMVLGIDEYLSSEDRDKHLEYVAFKKYYQRIFKHTDYFYTNWYKGSFPKKLYILGHSLDITDRDVLRELILHENVQTTVFYHSKKTNGKQIENLVKVLGYDNLNRLARGGDSNRKIVFKEQY